MRLHPAKKRKETSSLGFVQALEPRALRVVNDRPKAIGQAAALVGEADDRSETLTPDWLVSLTNVRQPD